MTLKTQNILGTAVIFGTLLMGASEAQAAREKFNKNNCVDHMEYLVLSLRNAGLKAPESKAVLGEAKVYDESITSFKVDATNAAYKNNYMPLTEGGFDWAWKTGESAKTASANKYFFQGGEYKTAKLLKAADIKKNVFDVMTDAELNELSAVRKYAIAHGDYGMKALEAEMTVRGPERARVGMPAKIEGWEGSCYAMRTTGCLLPEPNKAFIVTIKDGAKQRKIEFYPNDIKALAALVYKNSEKYVRAGDINYSDRVDSDPVNAAVYHMFKRVFRVMKTKYKSKPYAAIFDVDPGTQLWNEGFQNFTDTVSPIQKLSAAQAKDWGTPRGATQFVEVSDSLRLTHEASISATNRATRDEVVAEIGLNTESYSYRLYLDDQKNIVDGHWLGKPSATERTFPDFIGWPNGKGDPAGGGNPHVDFDKVMDLLEQSTTETARTIPTR